MEKRHETSGDCCKGAGEASQDASNQTTNPVLAGKAQALKHGFYIGLGVALGAPLGALILQVGALAIRMAIYYITGGN